MLLEALLALALLVGVGMIVTGLVDRAASASMRALDNSRAMDVARSMLSRIDAGLSRPEALDNTIHEETSDDGLAPDSRSSAVPPRRWAIGVRVEPSRFAGLAIVRVEVRREAPGEGYASLTQLISLAEAQERAIDDARRAEP